MIKLTIGNSTSFITGLNALQEKELRSLLSYTLPPEQTQYRRFSGPMARCLMSRKGEFPSGLLYIVESYLAKYTNPLQFIDTRVTPKSKAGMFNIKLINKPRDEQLQAANACVLNARGIVTAPTGSGKSLIVALIIDQLQVPTLVVVPSLELKRQLSDSLREYFGSLKNITVENIDALGSKKAKKGSYHCVIIDEFHHSGAKTYREVNKKHWNDVYYKFGLTATPFRSQDHEQILLQSVIGEVIYKIDYKTCVDKGYIVPLEAYYIDIPKVKPTGNTHKYASMYSELIVNNSTRNHQLHELLLKFHSNKLASLCLVKEIAHGEILSADGAFTFVQGDNPDNTEIIRMYNEGYITTIVATTGTLGEGVDTRPCEFVIIATPVKSKNLFMQMAGRAFRNHPGKTSAKIILLHDESHKWFKSAFKVQCKILEEEYGIIPHKLEMTNAI